MKPRDFRQAVVVVSGAGGGLGRALAERFAAAGSRVVLLDRDAAAVAAATADLRQSGAEAIGIECDVTSAAACENAVAQAIERFGRVDVLVNNAGITHRSSFAMTDIAVLRRVMEVNLFGAIHLTHAALAPLRAARGLIIAVSSVAGYTPLIARTAYAASKHALHGFFDSLRSELEADGVEVMLACPSFTATGIDRNALGPTGGAATHAQVVVGRRLSPDFVAGRILRAAARHRRLVLIGRTAQAAWWLSRVAPRVYARLMARSLRDEMQ